MNNDLNNNSSLDSNEYDENKNEKKWQWATPLIEGVPPSPRGGHTATKAGGCIIIFGGHFYSGKEKGFEYLNDTHVLDIDNNKWVKPKISGTPPAARYNHSAVLGGSRIIIFGGKGEKNKIYRDLHALDPVTMTWFQGPDGSGSPSPRFSHTSNMIGGFKMLLFGGWNGKDFFNDIYILDLESMAWNQPKCNGQAPIPRMGHSSILIGVHLIIHGGFTFNEELIKENKNKLGSTLKGFYLNDIKVLDTENMIWTGLRVTGLPPLARYGHTLNFSGPDIVLFGGWSNISGLREKKEDNKDDKNNKNIQTIKDTNINYFMILNTNTMSWEYGKYVGKPYLSRYGHTTCSIGSHLLIFGGWEYSRATNEVVVLRKINKSNNQIN